MSGDEVIGVVTLDLQRVLVDHADTRVAEVMTRKLYDRSFRGGICCDDDDEQDEYPPAAVMSDGRLVGITEKT